MKVTIQNKSPDLKPLTAKYFNPGDWFYNTVNNRVYLLVEQYISHCGIASVRIMDAEHSLFRELCEDVNEKYIKLTKEQLELKVTI